MLADIHQFGDATTKFHRTSTLINAKHDPNSQSFDEWVNWLNEHFAQFQVDFESEDHKGYIHCGELKAFLFLHGTDRIMFRSVYDEQLRITPTGRFPDPDALIKLFQSYYRNHMMSVSNPVSTQGAAYSAVAQYPAVDQGADHPATYPAAYSAAYPAAHPAAHPAAYPATNPSPRPPAIQGPAQAAAPKQGGGKKKLFTKPCPHCFKRVGKVRHGHDPVECSNNPINMVALTAASASSSVAAPSASHSTDQEGRLARLEHSFQTLIGLFEQSEPTVNVQANSAHTTHTTAVESLSERLDRLEHVVTSFVAHMEQRGSDNI